MFWVKGFLGFPRFIFTCGNGDGFHIPTYTPFCKLQHLLSKFEPGNARIFKQCNENCDRQQIRMKIKAPWDQHFNALVHECLIKKSHDQWNLDRLRTGFAHWAISEWLQLRVVQPFFLTEKTWVFFSQLKSSANTHNTSTCCPWKENDFYHMDVRRHFLAFHDQERNTLF